METKEYEVAYYAGGCFWGVEHLLKQQQGVISTEVGFSGGDIKNPSYQEVLRQDTGHAETVKVIFDPLVIDYEVLTKLFFEIHDPTQQGGQGPDMGDQYRSEIFYTTQQQKDIIYELIKKLRNKGYNVITKVTLFEEFFSAEDYHQDYYNKTGKEPYCHFYTKRF